MFFEFQTRKRRPNENWSDFRDELRTLTDKAFPGIDEKAKDLLSLERYLSELDNPKVAFAVQQRQLKTLDDVVSCMMEMESYISIKRPKVPKYQSSVIFRSKNLNGHDPLIVRKNEKTRDVRTN